MTTRNRLKAIVIGSGVGGIAAAIRLANMGVEVDVYEQNKTYGGKMGEWEKDGYRFDTGPSLFTMPQYVDELLQLGNKASDISFEYQKLEKVCNYFWEDGTKLTAHANKEELVKEFKEVLNEPEENILNFLKDSEKKYKITNHVFFGKVTS